MRHQIHTTYDHLLELSRPTTDGGRCDAASTTEAMKVGIDTGPQQDSQGAPSRQQTSSGPSLRQRRRAQQFIKASEALMAALGPQLFAQQRATRMLLAFGSAVARPKELYDLRFNADAAAAALSARELQQLRHRMIRTLVAEAAAGEEGPASAGPTRLWVLVASAPGAEVPTGFAPKRGLKLNLRKCVCSSITVGAARSQRSIEKEFSRLMHPQPSASASTAAGSSDSMCQAADGGGVPQEMWFQAKVVLKGMARGQDS